MIPLAFLGGALVGAAGLLTVALRDGEKTESALPSSLKHPGRLDEREIAALLADYSLAAISLSGKCNQVEVESGDLHFTSIPLDDDTLLQKVANSIGDGLTKTCRNMRCGQLNDLKEEAVSLYGRYRGVFRQANTLLCKHGRAPIDLGPIRSGIKAISVNNAINNEDWWFDFSAAVDNIRDFLDRSSAIAEQFIDIFEGMKNSPSSDGCESKSLASI